MQSVSLPSIATAPQLRGGVSDLSLPGLGGRSLGQRGKICPKRPMLLDRAPKEADLLLSSSPSGQPGKAGRRVLQGSNWGSGPEKSGVYKKRHAPGTLDKQSVFQRHSAPATQFRHFYERGDIPVVVKHGNTPGVSWKVEQPEKLDLMFILPKFFEGLMEKQEPYGFLAYYGLEDLLERSRGYSPSLVAPTIPSLIVPIKRCLHTRDNVLMCRCLRLLQKLVLCDHEVGPCLVPYFRHILPMFNMFKSKHLNLGDGMDYSQRHREQAGDLIQETLEVLERCGGDDAFTHIKYMVPTYESCVCW